MVKNRVKLLNLIIVVVLFILVYLNKGVLVDFDMKNNSSNVTNNSDGIKYNLVENMDTDMNLVFCPSRECYETLKNSFENAKSDIKCAFYEFDIENLSYILLDKLGEGVSVSLVIDDDYIDEEGVNVIKNSSISLVSDVGNSKYMHNKFCVIDNEIVISGSTNPTENGLFKNDNNMISFKSKYLAKNYINEFEQLKSGVFGYKKKSVLEYNNITLDYMGEKYLVSSYMCPEDDCKKEVLNILDSAKQDILFASFTLTLDEFENKLIEKSKEGVNISGVIERRMVNIQGSRISELNESFPVFVDKNKYNMHNKFFVVDSKYVITGSMNPSSSGVKYNDENILVIRNEEIAKKYRNYFLSLAE